MNPDASFTGRARRRTTRPGVRFGDTLARAVITLGGIGTIAAVLLMGVFLLAVALPLFRFLVRLCCRRLTLQWFVAAHWF